jgi:hypothetical protein
VSLHPYDGGTRCFLDSDPDPGDGLRIVARLLALAAPPPADGLRYDLSFYSGGMGIIDHVAIAIPIANVDVFALVRAAHAETLEASAADPRDGEYFLALNEDEDHAAARFINEHRASFQPVCRATSPIWFEASSGVNHWTALWESDGQLNYLAFDQG